MSEIKIISYENLDRFKDNYDEQVASQLSTKQNIIGDLAAIRSGAQAGATAVQPEDLASWVKQPFPPTPAEIGAQETLVSGENIKTINNQSILGSGNIEIQGGSGSDVMEEGEGTLSVKQRGTNLTTYGTASFAEGASATSAIERGMSEYSSNDDIITEWEKSYPAENKFTLVKGSAAHAEGNNGLALGDHSHVEGNGCIALDNSAHAEGTGSRAYEKYSHAEGLETLADGRQAHAEGRQTQALESSAHAEGQSTLANRSAAHAEGVNTVAGSGSRPTADSNSDSGKYTHAEGNGTQASGNSAHAEGKHTLASGESSHAEGRDNIASGNRSHVEGMGNEAIGNQSHAEGNETVARSWASHTEGYNTETGGSAQTNEKSRDTDNNPGDCAHAEGNATIAKGASSHAEGILTFASGFGSHAEGMSTTASHNQTHAEGKNTVASKAQAHAEGFSTTASGEESHAEGGRTVASGEDSHAEGYMTIAQNASEHAQGQYNVSHKNSDEFGDSGNTIHSIGIGSENSRANAIEVMQNGDVYVKGIGGYNGTSIDNVDTLQDVINGGSGGTTEVFWAEYGVTPFDDIKTAAESGLVVLTEYSNSIFILLRSLQNAVMFYSVDYVGDDPRIYRILAWKNGNWSTSYNSCEILNHKTTSLSSSSTDDQYPSAKCVYDSIQTSFDSLKLKSLTWEELKELRDDGELIEGTQYRITNYQASTTQEGTQSANHPFDIIVTADSTNTLNENARACLHSGDTYFSSNGANLEGWEIKYCLDNDKERFAWAFDIGLIEMNSDDVDYIKPPYDSLPSNFKQFLSNEGFDYENDEECGFWKARYEGGGQNIIFQFSHDGGASLYQDYEIYVPSDTLINPESLGDFNQNEDIPVGAIDGEYYDYDVHGTGVIYYMKDEWGNECPYDFKNIQFKRDTTWFNNYENWCESVIGETPDEDMYFYTFSWINENNEVEDLSLVGQTLLDDTDSHPGVFDNKISNYALGADSIKNGLFGLSNNIFVSSYNYDTLFYGCYGNKLGCNCRNNTFGDSCAGNTFGNSCAGNTFEDYCYSNTFGNYCNSNTFGNYCNSNTFGNYCNSNTFGNYCNSNTFGNNCAGNTFEDSCQSITFGIDCCDNTLGNRCQRNTFRNYCNSNTFGNYCNSNTFGNYCNSNTFGNNCAGNTFGDNCYDNTFGVNCDDNTFGNICSINNFGSDCQNIRIDSAYTKYINVKSGDSNLTILPLSSVSASNYIRNVEIASGVNGAVISIQPGLSYTTRVAKETDGTLRTYCPDDEINLNALTQVEIDDIFFDQPVGSAMYIYTEDFSEGSGYTPQSWAEEEGYANVEQLLENLPGDNVCEAGSQKLILQNFSFEYDGDNYLVYQINDQVDPDGIIPTRYYVILPEDVTYEDLVEGSLEEDPRETDLYCPFVAKLVEENDNIDVYDQGIEENEYVVLRAIE